MTAIKSFIKNAFSLASAELVTKFLAFLLVIYIARELGEVEFGKYAFALSFTLLFAFLSDVGLTQLTIREVAKRKEDAQKYLGSISAIKLILSILTIALVVVAINLLGYPQETVLAVYIAGGYSVINSFNQFLCSFYRAFEQMEYELATRVIEKIIIFSLAITFLLLGHGVIAVVSSFLIGSLIRLGISVFFVVTRYAKPQFNLDRQFIWTLFTQALPFGLTTLFVVIYFKIDTVMLSMMVGDAAVGHYNASYNIIEGLIALVAGSFGGVIFPMLSKNFTHSAEKLKKLYLQSFQIILIVGIMIFVFVELFSSYIIGILYGPEYQISALVLQIQIIAFLIICVSTVTSTLLNSASMQRIVAIGTGLGALLNVTLNYVLIPQYSLFGAAWATVITELFGFSLYFYYSTRMLNIEWGDFRTHIFILRENIRTMKNLIKEF